MCVCVCGCVRARARVRVCVRYACVRYACVRYACVRAWVWDAMRGVVVVVVGRYSMNIMIITCLFIIVDLAYVECRLGGVGQPRHHSDPKNLLPKNLVRWHLALLLWLLWLWLWLLFLFIWCFFGVGCDGCC